MNWYLFTSHVFRKDFIDTFIDKMNAAYGHSDNFAVYEKIDGNKFSTCLKTDDLKIAKIFINFFVDVDYSGSKEPNNFDLFTLKE